MKAKLNTNICGFTSKSKFAKLGHNLTVNCYVESTNVADKGVSRIIYGFGGFESYKNINGRCRGLHVVENAYDGKPMMFAVFGTKLYSIDQQNNLTEIGSVSVGQKKVMFAEVPIYGGGDSWLTLVDGSHLYAVNTTTIESERLHRLSLPLRQDNTRIEPNCVAYLYGMLVVNDSKTDAFYTSQTHPLFTRDGVTDFDVFMIDEAPSEEEGGKRPYYQYGYVTYSEYRGDKTLGMVSNGNRLFTLGENSLQVFNYNNVALSKSYAGSIVWSCPNSSCFNVGCSDYNSISQFGDSFYWVGRYLNGNLQVFTFNGSPVVISTPDMERELNSATKFNSFTFMLNGHPFYALTFNDTTYLYDIREQGWTNLCSNTDHCFQYLNSIWFGNNLYFGGEGKLVRYTEDNFTDCGEPIVRKRTGHIVSDTEVSISELKPIVNTGDGDMELRMNFSCDNKSFQMFTINYAGKEGEYDFEPFFSDLGEGENFSVELSTSSNAPFVLKDLEINYQQIIY